MRGRFKIAVFILLPMLFTGIALSSISLVYAQGNNPRTITDDQVNAVAKQLYCPVCENIPLDVCPTQACAQWRELIREKLAQGWSDAQIKQYFVDQYGDRVLATPPARGLNWLVYIIPPLVILLGVYLVYRAVSTWRQPVLPEAGDDALQVADNEYVRRLEEELRKR